MLNKEAIAEFKLLYRRRFKVELSDAKATRMATNLMNFYKIVFLLKNDAINQHNHPTMGNSNNSYNDIYGNDHA